MSRRYWPGRSVPAALFVVAAIVIGAACTATPPSNSSLPIVSGTAQQGQTLAVSTGAWSNSPTSYKYQWNRCSPTCAPIVGASNATYLLVADDVGSTLTATVIASNAFGPGAAATSTPTATVTPQTQVIAAGTSTTNLPTENAWPGAQNPPYICCWGSQGQYVTFSFSVVGGSTNLVLRYSAGNGDAHRKVELDGSVLLPNQVFAATANWSTWATLTLNEPALAAGAHTLKVWFDSTAGSNQYINLDNLTVTAVVVAPPPPGIAVSLGYAETAAGLTPWSGSPNTTFIGEIAQCCVTYGPDDGNVSYDAGVIEVTNAGESAVVVNSVTTDFGGGSSPSHFDLWSGATSPHLPQTVAPGAHLIVTMTSGFNFDTSDLLHESCHGNNGVAGVVHITMNGFLTDYVDSHQILDRDGTDLEFCAGVVSEQEPFAVVQPGTQPAAAPVNEVPPSVTVAGAPGSPGTPAVGRVLSGFDGGWNASPPPTLSSQWARCDASGNNCAAISGASGFTYLPTAADVGSTLAFTVTASNASGTLALTSARTSVVQTGATIAQIGHTSTGLSAQLISNTTELSWPSPATLSGTTNDFAFYARGGGNDQTFTPKLYSVVGGQTGSLLATGAPVTVRKGVPGQWYASSLAGVHLAAGSQYVLALDPSGAFNGTYIGGETTGESSFFVDFTPS